MDSMEHVVLDAERQRKARQYARLYRRLMLVDWLTSGVYMLAWLSLDWSGRLKAALLALTTHSWLLVIVFAAIFGGIYMLVNLPLTFYAGYILPHRYGMSTQTRRGWLIDQAKGLLLAALLGGLLLEVVYALLRAYPQNWWLLAGGILIVINVLLANLAPVLLMPIFYKFVPLSEEHADLAQRLVTLAERAGARVQGVYTFDMSQRTKAANAALTGLGNTRRIILGDTLLQSFTADEIETVLAHELGHHVHHDIPLGIAIESLITLGGLYLASLGLQWGVARFALQGLGDIAGLPLLALLMGLYGLLTMPLSNAFSRWRERRADAYAVRTTAKGKVYASALARLANQNLSDADPEAWVEFMFYSHPATRKRIEAALRVQNGSSSLP